MFLATKDVCQGEHYAIAYYSNNGTSTKHSGAIPVLFDKY